MVSTEINCIILNITQIKILFCWCLLFNFTLKSKRKSHKFLPDTHPSEHFTTQRRESFPSALGNFDHGDTAPYLFDKGN